MPRTATQFLAPMQLAASTATLFTTATGPVAVIRHVHFYNADSVSRNVTICQGADAAASRVLDVFPIAAKTAYDYYCYWVVPSNTIISGFASAATIVTCEVSGDSLSAG